MLNKYVYELLFLMPLPITIAFFCDFDGLGTIIFKRFQMLNRNVIQFFLITYYTYHYCIVLLSH